VRARGRRRQGTVAEHLEELGPAGEKARGLCIATLTSAVAFRSPSLSSASPRNGLLYASGFHETKRSYLGDGPQEPTRDFETRARERARGKGRGRLGKVDEGA